MSTGIEIRQAVSSDLSSVQDLNHKSFINDKDHDPYLIMSWPYDEETGKKFFSSRIAGHTAQNTPAICLVAEVADGTIVGYLAGAIHSIESYRSGVRSELENMYVEESVRRQKIGSALITEFNTWSLTNRAEELYVSAYFENTRAVNFYRNYGFKSYSHDLVLDLRAQ